MKPQIDLPTLAFSVEQVSKMIGQSDKTVYRLVKRGVLKSLPGLRHLRITAQSLSAFIAASDGGGR